MDRLDMLIAATRHFEFFWRPDTGLCDCKALHPTNLPPDPMSQLEGQRIDHSYRVFPSVRQVKACRERAGGAGGERPGMLPRDPCADDDEASMRAMPVEYRTVAEDNLLLSPNYGRPSVAISIHEFVDATGCRSSPTPSRSSSITAAARTGASGTRCARWTSPISIRASTPSTRRAGRSTRRASS